MKTDHVDNLLADYLKIEVTVIEDDILSTFLAVPLCSDSSV